MYKRQVLYTAESKGQNVHLSVLEQDGSGGGSIAYEVMGLSTEVAEVELAEVFGGSTQLVVDVYKRQSEMRSCCTGR